MERPGARTRNRDLRTSTGLTSHYEDKVTVPNVIIDSSYQGISNGSLEVINDFVTPNFRSIISNGGILNNPMSSTYENFSYPSVTVSQILTHPLANAGKISTVYSGFWTAVHDVVPRVYNSGKSMYLPNFVLRTYSEVSTRSKAAVGAKGKINPILVHSPVTLAEMPKTVRMIADAARTISRLGKSILQSGNRNEIFDLITGVKKGNSNRTIQALRGASSRYLEYRYGWRILLLEIQGLLKALDADVARNSERRAVARSRHESYRKSEHVETLTYSNAGTDSFLIKAEETIAASAYVLYKADLNYQPTRDWGIRDLPLAGWELIPFSFIVDWFVPIGNWLEAITPKAGVQVLAEGITTTIERKVTRTHVGWTPATSGTTRFSLSGQTGTVDVYTKRTRSRETTLALDLLLPHVDVNLNVARALDALAILVSVGRDAGISNRRL